MAFGVLEVRNESLYPVLGTSKILTHRVSVDDVEASKSSEQKTSDGKIILVPQPTTNPNDPLNWPLWRRDGMLVILCFASAFAVANNAVISQDIHTLAEYFDRPVGDIVNLVAYFQCACGVGGVFLLPFAAIWGKRNSYIVASALVTAGNIWAAASGGYKSMLWARVLQGFGAALLEVLVGISVADMYCVHQRGSRMAIMTLFSFAGGFLPPTFCGLISDNMGWRWIWGFLAVFSAVMLILIILFVEETTFHRPNEATKETGIVTDFVKTGSDNDHDSAKPTKSMSDSIDANPSEDESEHGSPVVLGLGEETIQRRTYIQRLALTHNCIPDLTIFGALQLFTHPFILLLHPAVIWFIVSTGTAMNWISFTATVIALDFHGPPLNFSSTQVGLMTFAAGLGSIIGFAICAVTTDPVSKFLASRNKGVYEPEFRLLLVIPQCIFAIIGTYGFGYVSERLEIYGWLASAAFFCLQVMSMVTALVAGSTYMVDAYPEFSEQAFTTFVIFKNFFGFGIQTQFVDWIYDLGVFPLFKILLATQTCICLTTIPLYILGKRLRTWSLRSKLC